MTPQADERERIRAAMERILDGQPIRSNGAMTIVSLSLEADVPRNALTQRHLDLKNEFYERVAEHAGHIPLEDDLRKRIAKLKKTICNKNAELARIREDVPALVRALNQLTVENARLRAELTGRPSTVVPFPSGGRT